MVDCEARLCEAESEISRLRAELQATTAENAELKATIAERDLLLEVKNRRVAHLESERDKFFDLLSKVYGAAVSAYARIGHEEKRIAAKWRDEIAIVEDVNRYDGAEPKAAAAEKAIEALAEIKMAETSATCAKPEFYRYDNKTLNERRGTALIDRMAEFERGAMGSSQCKAILEEIEGHTLHEKQVHRAMDWAAKAMKRTGGELDKLGGRLRLIIPKESTQKIGQAVEQIADGLERGLDHLIGGGGVDNLSRPRKDRVVWDPD